MSKDKNNNSDGHISAIALSCMRGRDVYQDLGNNKVEVAIFVDIPFPLDQEHIDEHRLNAFKFVWWFELLEKKLEDLSHDPMSVYIEFFSKDLLIYWTTLDCPSIEEAMKVVHELESGVLTELDSKLESASDMYLTNCLVPYKADES